MKAKLFFLGILLVAAGFSAHLLQKALHSSAGEPAVEQQQHTVQVDPAALAQAKAKADGERREQQILSLTDHEATAFKIRGTVEILRAGEEGEGPTEAAPEEAPSDEGAVPEEHWVPLEQGTVVREGDKVRTGMDSFAEFYYDSFYLNTAHLSENSIAHFYSIEPTQVYLLQGEILNTLDGLPEEASYAVASKLGTAAVRGTQFARYYDPVSDADSTLVVKGVVSLGIGPGYSDTGRPLKTLEIRAGEGVTFSKDEMKQALPSIGVVEISADDQNNMNRFFARSRRSIEEYAGGPEALDKAREEWASFSADPAVTAKIRARNEIAGFKYKYDRDEPWRTIPIAAEKFLEKPLEPDRDALAKKEDAGGQDREWEEVKPDEEEAEEDSSDLNDGEGTEEETEELSEADIAHETEAMTIKVARNVCDQTTEECGGSKDAEAAAENDFCQQFPDSPDCVGQFKI